MLDVAADALFDAFVDTLKLVPFLFVTSLAMEALEHGTSGKARDAVMRAGRLGPVIGSVLGALAYVALYMLKTFIFGKFIDGLTMDAVTVKLLSTLPGSLMNAAFAFIVAPILFNALRPALRSE